jgi:S1-C subfamily serine protease
LVLAAFLAWRWLSVDPVRLAARAQGSIVLVEGRDRSGGRIASAAGFFIAPGRLLTSLLVLEGATTASAEWTDPRSKRKRSYQVTGYLVSSPQHGLVVLVTSEEGAPRLPLGDDRNLAVGNRVYVLGAPNDPRSFSEGLVATPLAGEAKNRHFTLTGRVSRGSAGNPVLDTHGRVVGVLKSSRNDGQDVSLAVSVATLRALLVSAKPKPFVKVLTIRFQGPRPSVGYSSLWLSTAGGYDFRDGQLGFSAAALFACESVKYEFDLSGTSGSYERACVPTDALKYAGAIVPWLGPHAGWIARAGRIVERHEYTIVDDARLQTRHLINGVEVESFVLPRGRPNVTVEYPHDEGVNERQYDENVRSRRFVIRTASDQTEVVLDYDPNGCPSGETATSTPTQTAIRYAVASGKEPPSITTTTIRRTCDEMGRPIRVEKSEDTGSALLGVLRSVLVCTYDLDGADNWIRRRCYREVDNSDSVIIREIEYF